MRRSLAALSFALLLSASAMPLLAGATITIVNVDAPGVGFNDPTPAVPVGGNNGTTIGQQRLNVFEYSAGIWGQILTSPVPIFIQASFAPLTCSATSGTLGQAGPMEIESDWSGLVPPARHGTWYAVALANKLAGRDLEPETGSDGYDIEAEFNGSLGTANCLTGTDWYYGLDGNHGDNDLDLAVVLLHEFAHGLGFINFVDDTTGAYLQGQPDVASFFTFDDQTGLHWTDMSSVQRAASAINSGHLTWDGANTTAAAQLTLSAAPAFIINSPAAIAGSIPLGTASFGPPLTLAGLTGNLVLANDPADSTGPTTTDGCSPFTNPSAVAGKIALVDRGSCNFSLKAENAQAAGALGLVIADNVEETIPGLGGSDSSVTIPTVEISEDDGTRIKGVISQGVNVTIELDATELAGADPANRLLLFAPNPLQEGSSVSHWDTSATPNLLMEPDINPDLQHKVDLTKNFFEDIGWFSPVGVTATLAAQASSGNAVSPGDTISYTATIQNGADDIDGIGTEFALTLDPNTTLVGTPVASAGTVTVAGNKIEVDLGSVVGGTTVTVTFEAKVNSTIMPGATSISVQGTITGRNFTSLSTDDPSTQTAGDATVTPLNLQPLTASMSATDLNSDGPVTRGDRIRYTVVVSNPAASPAAIDASFTVTPAPDTTLDSGSVTTTNGTVVTGNAVADSTVNVALGTIAPGAMIVIRFDVDVDANTPAGVFSLATQGTVSGTNFTSVLTDDPTTPTPGDPTLIFLGISRHRAVRP